jgi:hypothetical protein
VPSSNGKAAAALRALERIFGDKSAVRRRPEHAGSGR